MKTLLLIDDQPDVLLFLQSILDQEYHVLLSDSAVRGIQIMKEQVVDLVVSDVIMPHVDGFEFCRLVKIDLSICHIPIILLTVKNTMDDKIAGLEYGADAYVEKPFETRLLKAQISSILRNRQQLKQHFVTNPLATIEMVANTQKDHQFLASVINYIHDQLDNDSLDVNLLASAVNVSRSGLYRKISEISSLSPHEFINNIRLKRAAELLSAGGYQAGEVAALVGYKSLAHFGKLFTREFGIGPREFMKKGK